jgi:soluble lytic murein transglycosylase
MSRLTRYTVILAGLALALAGCDTGTTDNVTYVVITGEPPAAEATLPPPTDTAIPPSPTPDIAPEVAMQIGDRYLLDGYYEDAVLTYRSILNRGNDAPGELRAEAAFKLGQAALREGLFESAVDSLTTLISQFPDDTRTAQAYFLRGDAYLGLSRWQDAISDFQQYLALRPGLIDSYAYERIGDAQLALEQFDAAVTSYNQATEASRTLVPQLVLREKVARLHILSRQVDQAVAQYDAILEVARNAPYRASIEFLAAEALLDAGRTEDAITRFRRIFESYPQQIQAYRAMNILLEQDVQLDSYEVGRVAYLAGDHEAAIEAFNTFTTQTALSEIPAELHLLLGRAYRAVGNSEAALVAFQTIVAQYANDPLFGDALLEQGRTRFLDDEIDEAIEFYLQIVDNYDYLADTAAEALWRAGYLHGTHDNLSESRAIFMRLAETYPESSQASSGLFIAASAALNAGDTVGAETLYARLAATTTGTDRASAYLQVGRLALERGDENMAQSAFREASTAAPDTYFSARAEDLMAGRAPFTPPAQFVFEFDDLAEVTEAENWLRATFEAEGDGPLWPLSPELEADLRIIRGRELWTVGAFDEAQTEFLDVLEDYRGDGLASYRLAIFMRMIGAYYPSIVGGANVITAAGAATLEAPAFIARLRYPAYYRDLVLRATEARNIDPLVMFSLIRHESLFNTNATAAADEKGLTQVIPGTGEYIANQLNWPDYQHSDLFRPHAGIEFGAYYLGEQYQRFNGNVYAALAAYNAGPGRSQSWLQLSGGDPDVFMSTITISTVQTYIQRIYSSYNIYRELYGTDT